MGRSALSKNRNGHHLTTTTALKEYFGMTWQIWMKLVPESKFYAERPYSARRIRKIEYQKNVVREWLHRSGTVFVEDYTNVECDGLMEELGDTHDEKCMALKDKKCKHPNKEADSKFREILAKRSRLPPKKEDPGSVTIICQIGKAGVNALCDVGSSVNVIPLSLADKFKLALPIVGTARELILANQSSIHSVGTVRDVLVKVKNL